MPEKFQVFTSDQSKALYSYFHPRSPLPNQEGVFIPMLKNSLVCNKLFKLFYAIYALYIYYLKPAIGILRVNIRFRFRLRVGIHRFFCKKRKQTIPAIAFFELKYGHMLINRNYWEHHPSGALFVFLSNVKLSE
jgi:hypothetical protein